MKKLFVLLSLIISICETELVFANNNVQDTIRLMASEAMLSEGLTLKDGTIHKWYKTDQRITWHTNLKAGRYVLNMRYAEPYEGAVVSISIGNRKVVSMLPSSGSWSKFRNSELGVISVEKDGSYDIILQGRQLSLIENENREALPDLHWLMLTATQSDATDEINSSNFGEFKGKSLFDGKTFNGWEGNNGAESMKWFRIENSAIVAGSMKENIPRNEFLRTTRKYSNFELRLKFRVVAEGNNGWNGGIQFRSIPHPTMPHEMVGYQADIIGKRWGALYDESRRNRFLGTILSEQQCNPGEWNEYVLRCEGARIRLWLNGQPVVDYTEPFAYKPHSKWGIIPQKGYIALQIHERNNPYEIWYKDIQIQELHTPTPHFKGYKAIGKLAAGTPTADSLGWKIGVQAYDFKRVATFFEAIDLTAALGLKYIEGVGMQLSSETKEHFGPDMTEEWKERTKQKLIDAGIECCSYYRRINANDAERVYSFCKEMNLTLVTDPVRVAKGPGSMDFYEALAKKHGVRTVLTNHPKNDNSPYYDPDIVLEDLAGRDSLLGASIDIGHFMRDGRQPLDIVRKYITAGRLYHFHFRDVEGLHPNSPDITVGNGMAQIPEIFQLLCRNGIHPIIMMEYEKDMYNPLLYLIPSVGAIERIIKNVK
ncbi:MAG: family 16 glycoside hydrolase [Prevotella sp.]